MLLLLVPFLTRCIRLCQLPTSCGQYYVTPYPLLWPDWSNAQLISNSIDRLKGVFIGARVRAHISYGQFKCQLNKHLFGINWPLRLRYTLTYWLTDFIHSFIHNYLYTPCFRKKLHPLLFHHIFALTATNCMKISRSIQEMLRCLLWM